MIARVENAIKARLKLAASTNVLGYSWRTLETAPDNWDDQNSFVWAAPAAWVVFAGMGEIVESDAGGARAVATFAVVVAAQSARNEEASRHGGVGPAEPGSFQLVQDVASLLIGQDLGLDIDRIRIVAVQPMRPPAAIKERGSGVSMWALMLATTIPIAAVDPNADPETAFEVFHANWDVPAFGNVDADLSAPGAQIPADRTADATDHLELPQ